MDTYDDNVDLDESAIKGIQNGDISPKPPLIVKSNVNPRFRTRNENCMIPGKVQRTIEPSDKEDSDHEYNSQLKIRQRNSTIVGSAGIAV